MASPGRKKNSNKKTATSPSTSKAFRPKAPELTVVALLLSGKLRLDSVQLYRGASVVVSLVGEYKTLSKFTNADKLLSFLDENGDMTLNDMIDALKQRTGNSS